MSSTEALGWTCGLSLLIAIYLWLERIDRRKRMLIGATLCSLLLSLPVQAQSDILVLNTLDCLNCQRAHARPPRPALLPDPRLQAAAEWAVRIRAARDIHGHLQGKPVAGRWEGTSSRSFRRYGFANTFACYQDHNRARYAGMASAYNPRTGKVYHHLNLR